MQVNISGLCTVSEFWGEVYVGLEGLAVLHSATTRLSSSVSEVAFQAENGA